VTDEALIGSLLFSAENPSKLKYSTFKQLYERRSTKFSFGRMSETFNILPKETDTFLFFRFRYFYRLESFTSAISDLAMAYVDWISYQEYLRVPVATLAVMKVSDTEWNTGPKQRSNQWSCPPFILLEKVSPSRFAIGLDPSTEESKNKVLAFMALDPERLDGNDPEFMMDVGDNKFPYFKQSKSRYANNIRREENEEDDDGDLSVNSSVNSRNEDESPLTCAMPPNIMDFLTYVDSSRL
jgi:hypothetical protein